MLATVRMQHALKITVQMKTIRGRINQQSSSSYGLHIFRNMRGCLPGLWDGWAHRDLPGNGHGTPPHTQIGSIYPYLVEKVSS